MRKIQTNNNTLYVRASLRGLRSHLLEYGSVSKLLGTQFEFTEIFSPYFAGQRPFWRPAMKSRQNKSGVLGELIKNEHGSMVSQHPSHGFVGVGKRVQETLLQHDHSKSCFFPISEMSESGDFSMLLLGCIDESPGFSTVHATQYKLGLSQKHLLRFLLRWDYSVNGNHKVKIPEEFPGCSRSFSKFYSHYQDSNNLLSGELFGSSWLFLKSARRAIQVEHDILKISPKFVDCGRLNCVSCRFRLY